MDFFYCNITKNGTAQSREQTVTTIKRSTIYRRLPLSHRPASHGSWLYVHWLILNCVNPKESHCDGFIAIYMVVATHSCTGTLPLHMNPG